MSTEQKDLEQNALASRLSGSWTRFKQGKLIGYKWMALLLLVVTALGLWWYISHERKKANSARWVSLDEANTPAALEELSANNPDTIQGRLARLQLARSQLGEAGIDQLGALGTEQQKKAVENIEKARTAFGTLLEEFKDDPVFKAECLLGLAKAELALVAVPAKIPEKKDNEPTPLPTEFKGTVEKAIGYLDQLTEVAAPNTAWAADSKKMADLLRTVEGSPRGYKDVGEFIGLMRGVFDLPSPAMPRMPTGLGPEGPLGPGGPPLGTLPILPGGK